MNMIRFENVRKSFGDKVVLDGLTFTVERGEVYGLLGPNGCGKTTAINILCNLLDLDSGSVWLGDRPVANETNRLIGVCPQEIALYRDLYPAENLRFFAQVYGLPAAERASRVAELENLFGLAAYARTPTGSLSGGWQRRVNIATALVHKPEMLVLDEPTAAIDIEARYELWEMIGALRKSGMTLLLTTHHLDEAERLCTRIGIMRNGHIAKQGTVDELLASVPAKAIAIVETADENAVLARAANLGWSFRRYAGKIGCLLPQQLALRSVVDALQGIDVSAVSVQRVTLEHAYLEVMRDEQPEISTPPPPRELVAGAVLQGRRI